MSMAHACFNILHLPKGIPFDVSSTSPFAYVTITIMREASARPCLFQPCTSDVNNFAYLTGSMPQDGSALNPRLHVFWHNYTISNCLLTLYCTV